MKEVLNLAPAWGADIVERFRQIWNDDASDRPMAALFADGFDFHYHDREIEGIDAYRKFMGEAGQSAQNLRLNPVRVICRDDLVLLYFYWSSDRWHADIQGADKRSNFGKIVLRIAHGRIVEKWEQASDFLFLLGKGIPTSLMNYPQVVSGGLFLEHDGGLFATNDAETIRLCELFRRMNDCFLGHAPLSKIVEIQEPDIQFDFDEGRQTGEGIESWKTFAYALRTASRDAKATRFDDIFIRKGNRLSVFSRSWMPGDSPYILACANGIVAGLSLEASSTKIQALHTFVENYVPFLDTHFHDHDARIRELFQGRRRPVIQGVRERLPAATVAVRHEVAIVGMAGRFPGASSVEEFWELLSNGRDAISEFPKDREYLKRGTLIRRAAFLNGVDRFDAAFFNLPPALVEYMDPQQRLMMEVIWQSLEDSGHVPGDFAGGRTALFVSTLSDDYKKRLQEHGAPLNGFFWMGNETAMFPAKIARFLKIQGPARFIQAECASSLVALHEASRLIRTGEMDQAIVGAVNLFQHSYGFAVREEQLLTKESHPRMFSKESCGQVRGEAVVSVVLKSLSKALADGDSIYGLVAGSAVNSNGETLSIISPSVEQEARVMQDAWRDAGMAGAEISSLECQASGVRDGDFAEIASIKKALKMSGNTKCRLSTCKGAVGHSEAASGLSALVKALLQFRHHTIAGIRGLEQIDPLLGLDGGTLELVKENSAWESDGRIRICGINAFATGGYNSHVVVKEYLDRRERITPEPGQSQIVILSARTEKDLGARCWQWRRYLKKHPSADLSSIAYTLQCGREAMLHRISFVVSTIEELVAKLDGPGRNGNQQHAVFVSSGAKVPARTSAASRGLIDELVRQRNLMKLAELWSQGGVIPWQDLWPGAKPVRGSGLPGYPFSGEKFGLPASEAQANAIPVGHLHPFLGQNKSTLDRFEFESTFTGAEFFIADHLILGQRMFPAAGFLEMARAAFELALPNHEPGARMIRLREIAWIRAWIIGGSPATARVTLAQENNGRIAFEIGNEGGVFCDGTAERSASVPMRMLDIPSIQQECVAGMLTAPICYERLRMAGMAYGPAYQSIQSLQRGQDCLIAKLTVPEVIGEFTNQFILHPSLLDGAFQSLVGFGDASSEGQILTPFAVEELLIHGPCNAPVWVVVRIRNQVAHAHVRKFDIEMCAEPGLVLVEIKGLSCRVFKKEDGVSTQPSSSPLVKIAPEKMGERYANAIRFFKREIGSVIKLPPEQIDADAALEQFGIDSALAVALVHHLSKTFGSLPKTLFFECRTVRETADYFLEAFPKQLEAIVGAAHHDASSHAPSNSRVTRTDVRASAPATSAGSALDIAIIGLAGSYPGARSIGEFWQNLRDGKDSITEIPPDRWDHSLYFDADKKVPGKTYSKWGGFLTGVDEFDAAFFNISPWEAERLDPQERLFLQCAFQTMEDAGYTRSTLGRDRVGTFVGVMYEEYQLYGIEESARGNPVALFGSPASIANRVSYYCNFRGPSMAVDTMCSSSLTAIHLACQSLARGECSVALAGGVNVSVHPNKYLVLGQGRFVSSKGRCESFGEGAEGYVPGEGVGAVLLKPLAQARADGDRIYGVIKGSAVNHGGKNNGYTVPHPQAQSESIEMAMRESGIDPRTVSYVEAHGTGTSLGDPIEISGLKKAFGRFTQDRGFCSIGSVKSNIGHCESAAGMAGLTKILLQMAHGKLVPSLHSSKLNPDIDFVNSPFVVQQTLADWERPLLKSNGQTVEVPRRAGLSSFGAGGSNAHMIVEEFVDSETTSESIIEPVIPAIILLSAKSAGALKEMAIRLHQFLFASGSAATIDLHAVARTLQTGREAMEERLGFLARSNAELRDLLAKFINGDDARPPFVRGRFKPSQEKPALFESEEKQRETIEAWIKSGNHEGLLDLWIKGFEIDSTSLYEGRGFRKVRLPSYPFSRDRHWIVSKKVEAKVESKPVSPTLPPTAIPLLPVWDSFSPKFPRSSEQTPEGTMRSLMVGGHATAEAIQKRFLTAAHLELQPGESTDEIEKKLKRVGDIDHLIWMAPESSTEGDVLLCFRFIKAMLRLGYGGRELCWTLITRQAYSLTEADRAQPGSCALHGLFGSMTREYPLWKSRCLDFENEAWLSSDLPFPMAENPVSSLALRSHQWHRQKWVAMDGGSAALPLESKGVYRTGGVYIVIGGAGGIGTIWTNYMIRNYRARIIWIGRRPKNAEIQSRIDAASVDGIAPEYFSADATDRNALQKAYDEIKRRHGRINGVIHSAIVLADQTLKNMEEAQFLAGFSAKASVATHLAAVFGRESLDFILFFSSMMSFSHPAGQSNYAAGSLFGDAMAARLSKEISTSVKVVNWGFWGGAGSVASDVYRARMAQAGWGSIEPDEGMRALEILLSGPVNQLALVKVVDESIAKKMGFTTDLFSILPVEVPSLTSEIRHQWTHVIDRVREIRNQRHDLRLDELEREIGLLLAAQLAKASNLPHLTPPYDRWIAESQAQLDTLKIEKVDPDDVWNRWERKRSFWLDNPETTAQIHLVEAALKALPGILHGTKKATEVLFPNGSMALVQGIYKNNLASDFFNEAIADAVLAFVRLRSAEGNAQPIRILEIGAGTGGTTIGVLKAIQPFQNQILEYCHTDLSNAFSQHAKETFGRDYPFLTFRIFDVSKSLAEQGIPSDRFDIVIATNVLHATRNIRTALQNAKAVLRRNGLLLLNELNAKTLFTHVTFGLLDGWWFYDDGGVRIPGSPGLTSEAWRRALASEGFRNVFFPLEIAHDFGQQVIVAESDGIIRQSRAEFLKEPVGKMENRVTPGTFAAAKTDSRAEGAVRDLIVEKLQESLKIDSARIDFDGSFSDLGVDSITGIGFVESMNAALKIDLSTTDLFDHSSVNRMTAHVVSRYRPEISTPVTAEKDGGVPFIPALSGIVPTTSTPPSKGGRDAVAIIGMSGRFAGSATLDELWEHLAKGDDLVGETSRWDLRTVLAKSTPSGSQARRGSFLDRIDEFDPLFFNISGTEATYMDPQQRLFLEEAWKALEDAGYAGSSIHGCSCGIYAGHNSGDYKELFDGPLPPQAMWGNAASVIPARLSYFLNLHGPAIAVDTACSSSLVAIHLACQGLWSGEMEMALAGGVFIQSTPMFFVAANRAAMLSPTGCHTFDQKADGFVPGEGVGVVVLKRLSDALRDGDQIHGVIRGSGMNQDGATNGVTAPSAESQERLERQVYESFEIHPESIQMMEAHGTGTKLGDPIEFEALTRAFRTKTEKKHFCAIGSIKTNIGHTTAAAGVAGLLKILLSLRQKQIPASLHFEKGNSAIRFEGSPFYVSTTLAPWNVEPAIPRRAALSAFGFSGTNAHMVIEEAPARTSAMLQKPLFLIVLSARSLEQLRVQALQLIQHLEGAPHLHIGDASFTLLLGRRHFEHRLSCVIGDASELMSVLTKWHAGGRPHQVTVSHFVPQNFRESVALKRFGNDCIESCRNLSGESEIREALSAIADLFLQGYALEFHCLFPQGCGSRISLPTYPFAKERYWVDMPAGSKTHKSSGALSLNLHPHLHANLSQGDAWKFSARFDGSEFFLQDHRIHGKPVLPAAAYLEMARVAASSASVSSMAQDQIVRLKNVAWYRPFSMGDGASEIEIMLKRVSSDEVSFEIGGSGHVHSRGSIDFLPAQTPARLDLNSLRNRSTAVLSGEACYKLFREAGLNYGPAHQCIEVLEVTDAGILARLRLPDCVASTLDAFVLHPSLLDGALQTIVGFGATQDQSERNLIVPFALDAVEIHQRCSSEMWAVARRAGASAGENAKFDIDICDDQGNLCVRFMGLTTRQLGASESAAETVFFVPSWEVKSCGEEDLSADHRRVVFLCESDPAVEAIIEAAFPAARVYASRPKAQEFQERFRETGGRLLEALQNVLRDASTGRLLFQVVHSMEGENALYAGLAGMLKTAALENPNIRVQIIGIPNGGGEEALVEKLIENGRSPNDLEIRYRHGKRHVAGWREIETGQSKFKDAWRGDGVYLITGGGGGLGSILARELAHESPKRTIILAGRSEIPSSIQALIERSESGSARIVYRKVDVADETSVTNLIDGILREFGSLHGVFHAAGVVRDQFIVRKSVEELRAVFAPKVAGLIHLDRASSTADLDFFILFSAVAGVLGNAGQADYAAANAFMDAFAGYRNELVSTGARKGKTLSIDWPLWVDGGMQPGAGIKEMMERSHGMRAMESSAGLQALADCMAFSEPQILVLEGDSARLRSMLSKQVTLPSALPRTTTSEVSAGLTESAVDFLQGIVASVVGLPRERIDIEAPMEKFGIDSLMVMTLTEQLEKRFGSLSKTLFFEYQTIRDLAGYFAKAHGDKFGSGSPKKSAIAETSAPSMKETRPPDMGDIAIIGLAGRFPQADSMEAFWTNLREGRDCITEIPKDRWDHSKYFDADREARGKTYAKWGGFLNGVDQFDAGFFNISPREAAMMDPQERLFLECVYGTIEDAGYTRESLRSKSGINGEVGVYVGVMYEEYQLYGAEETALGHPLALPGNPSSIANRVSYFCNFHGPSMAVDTMCSSSLTAIHLACKSLRDGECRVAIAGGVNVSIHPNKYLMLAQGNFAASNGRCESFGKGGDGYVPAEGVGAVLLKPLAVAITDGDHIYGVIKTTAINHGGKTNGYTVPNPNLQADLIERALAAASIHPRTISYLEAHGTGTSLGDPIEITGLSRAFSGKTVDRQFCSIGSVKSNIGHCESAAGMAGLAKILLQMKHRQLVPSLHATTLNPNIDFASTPFVVQQQLSEWKRPVVEIDGRTREFPRLAGLSSFGAGGSYAHVVVEEWISTARLNHPGDQASREWIVLSAKSAEALGQKARSLRDFLSEGLSRGEGIDMQSLAYTLQVGREAMEERWVAKVQSIEDLRDKLDSFLRGDSTIAAGRRGSLEIVGNVTPTADEKSKMERWVEQSDFDSLIDAWLHGAQVDWEKLHAASKPRRMSLPTYPFKKERHWFSAASTMLASPLIVREIPEERKTGKVALRAVNLKSVAEKLQPLAKLEAKKKSAERVVKSVDGQPSGLSLSGNGQPSGVSSVPVEVLQRELSGSLAAALFMKTADIHPDKTFIDLGLDSIVGVEWIRSINRQYGTAIAATKVYDHPCIRKFAVFLHGELTSKPPSLTPTSPSVSMPAEPWTENYGLVLRSVGLVNEVALQPWQAPEPLSNEVMIQVRASALNFPDTMCVTGLYPTMPDYPFVPGFEVSGIIVAAGHDVSGLKPGDEVIALTGKTMGGHSSRVTVPASGVVLKPSNISFEDACSMPVVFTTVYHAFRLANIARGEHVLIQTATGGCGLVALQLARLRGAICYGTSSRDEKLDLLRRLRVDHALNYKGAFDLEIARLTEGRGVDVVLNMLPGEAIQRGLNCLASSGRYLEIAVHGLKTSPKLDFSRLIKNQSFHSIDLRQLSLQGGFDGREALEAMVAMLKSESIVPIVSRVYPVGQIREALTYIGQGGHIGKVVISHTLKTMEDRSEVCIENLLRQTRRSADLPATLPAPVVASPTNIEPSKPETDIAIIGMAGQFPKSPTLDIYWQNIVGGVDCISEVPSSRWSAQDFYDATPKTPGKTSCKWMGVLDHAGEFDPLFFNISPAEAEWMDPQQRLFLQSCWHCIEDAGIAPSALSGSRCGVFAGCGPGDYAKSDSNDALNAFGLMGGATSILASRISYFLNLRGPCLAIDTACSSSLVAIAEGCQSLVSGTSDIALAGGVYVMAGPSMHIMTSQAGMLSRDGKCYPFDSRANGFVPGEGVGVVLLKRLSDALRDKDPIQGIIRGWGINQDGRTNGITAPSVTSQIELEHDLYKRFGINPESISLLEAHGTGTQLGDPIEAEALVASFRQATDKTGFCSLGSVKSNIGHLMPAAGIAGVIKVLLSMKHQTLAPMIHFEKLNEYIDLSRSAFRIETEKKPWNVLPGNVRRAAVSSFGFSGTNAHLVVEEPMAIHSATASGRPILFVLSAKNLMRLQAQAKRWIDWLRAQYDIALADIAYTLQVGRDGMEQRLAIVATDKFDLIQKLDAYLRGEPGTEIICGVAGQESATGISDTDEGRRFVSELGRNQRLAPLARLWVGGDSIDWALVHAGSMPRRVSGLPPYAFANDLYWRKSDSGKLPIPTFPIKESTEPFELLTFEETWVEDALSPENGVTRSHAPQSVVCVLATLVLRDRVAKAITQLIPGAEISFVSLGDDFKNAWTTMRENHRSFDALFYLAAMEQPSAIADHTTVMRLLQSMASAGVSAKRFYLAGEFVNALERCHFETSIGLERSIGRVMPSMEFAVVFRKATTGSNVEEIIGLLGKELASKRTESVYFDAGKRLVYRNRPVQLTRGVNRLREGGFYLITGGCGGLGMVLARHLAQKYRANLVLTGRRALSPQQQTTLRQLEQWGGSILYLQADVADRLQMEDVVKTAKDRFGSIHGILHLAGTSDAQNILQKTVAAFSATLRPKIDGTLILDEVTRGENFDFVCYFSSTSAVLGDSGACDYSMANRFQMAFANSRNERVASGDRFGKILVINWPVWREGTMRVGAEANLTEDYLRSSGQRFLETTEGLELFERLLAQDRAQHLVIAGQKSRAYRFLGIGSVNDSMGAAPTESVMAHLKSDIHVMLKIPFEQMDIKTNFTDFGFDSISLEEWSRSLSRHFGIEILPTVFFANPTLEKLERHLALTAPRANIPAGKIANVNVDSKVPENAPGRFEPIAIIGMSGRFPKANDIAQLWKNICAGTNCITEVPKDRAGWPNDSRPAWGGFIDGIDCFDPLFFEIAPRDAIGIDPRQRLFLEEAWHAFEDAGYMGGRIRGSSCGVFVGVEEGEYGFLASGSGEGSVNGNQNATLAARIAYTLDLKGPNFALNAACSSGLVAVHQACLALRQGDCDMALAGGINLLVSPLPHAGMQAAGMISKGTSCPVFDASADGLIPGEAVVAIVLKPLSKAIRDGDRIHGCIRASGVNYDGRTNGITAPDPHSQAALLKSIYDSHGINPRDIQFLLAHSVGSKLGDPVEIEALTKSFGGATDGAKTCQLGSVKPLIGHTFAASGLVHLMVMLMAMKHRTKPGLPHFKKANPYLHLENSPFLVSRENQVWTCEEGRRRLGALGSTGISGTNAHVVIEEFIGGEMPQFPDAQVPSGGGRVCVPLSARTQKSLLQYAVALADFMEAEKTLPLRDIAHTFQIGRDSMAIRAAFVVQSRQELIAVLRHFAISETVPAFNSMNGVRVEEDAARWQRGESIAWVDRQGGGSLASIITLPTYPFERKRYWATLTPPARPPEKAALAETIPNLIEEKGSLGKGVELAGLKSQLKAIIETVFLMDEEIDENRPLFEIGMTSINVAQFIEALNEQLNASLELTDVFDCPTVQKLAERLALDRGHGRAGASVALRETRANTEAPVQARRNQELSACGTSDLDILLSRVADNTMGIDEALQQLESQE